MTTFPTNYKEPVIAIVDYSSFAAKVYIELSEIFQPILTYYNDETAHKHLIVMPYDVKNFIEIITASGAGIDPMYELEEKIRQRYYLSGGPHEPKLVTESLTVGCAAFVDLFEQYTNHQLRNSYLLDDFYYFKGWLSKDSFSCILANY